MSCLFSFNTCTKYTIPKQYSESSTTPTHCPPIPNYPHTRIPTLPEDTSQCNRPNLRQKKTFLCNASTKTPRFGGGPPTPSVGLYVRDGRQLRKEKRINAHTSSFKETDPLNNILATPNGHRESTVTTIKRLFPPPRYPPDNLSRENTRRRWE